MSRFHSSLKNKAPQQPLSGWIWSLPRFSGLAQFGMAIRIKYKLIRYGGKQGKTGVRHPCLSPGDSASRWPTSLVLESSPSYALGYPATIMSRSKKLDYYSVGWGYSHSDLINIGEDSLHSSNGSQPYSAPASRFVRHSKNKKSLPRDGQGVHPASLRGVPLPIDPKVLWIVGSNGKGIIIQ